MFKFFKNLFFPQAKEDDEIEVTLDADKGTIQIVSSKPLTDEEIVEIAKAKVREMLEGEEDDD